MPVYDYLCKDCGKDFDIFLNYAEYGHAEVRCPACDSRNVTRKIHSVRVTGSDRERLRKLSEEASGDNSSQMLGKVMRTIQQQSGRDLPPDTNEALTRLEKGESPASINKDYD